MNPREMLLRYQDAVQAHREGKISGEELRSACQGLEARDEAGRRWAVDAEGGQLLCFDEVGKEWRAVAPLETPQKAPSRAGEEKGKGKAHTAPQADLGTAAPLSHTPASNGILRYLGHVQREGTGVQVAAVVFGACALLAWVAWDVLGFPYRLLRGLVEPGFCGSLTTGSIEMFLCSAKVVAEVSAGPILVILLLMVFIRPLARVANRQVHRLPRETRFLAAPLLATAVFTVMWAGTHHETGVGILDLLSRGSPSAVLGFLSTTPKRTFPALIGLFTWGTMYYGREIQDRFRDLFRLRERAPRRLRLLLVLAIPFALSFIITFPQRDDPLKFKALTEQFVVIVTILSGYVLLAPRAQREGEGSSAASRPGGRAGPRKGGTS